MLKIYDTLTRELQEFKPLEDKKVKFYQCGPTVYWIQHIGNMRAMVMSDLIRRTLEFSDYKVKFVRNYTDFGHLTGDNLGDADTGEDRMEKTSRNLLHYKCEKCESINSSWLVMEPSLFVKIPDTLQTNQTCPVCGHVNQILTKKQLFYVISKNQLPPEKIADYYIRKFDDDVNDLNTEDPSIKARATHYIKEMISMVNDLLDKGYAYSTPLAIYFDIKKYPNYTKLSGQKIDFNETGKGHGDVEDLNHKRNPQDFAVWFFKAGTHANALQYWESPFSSPLVEKGYGFPGWHIECSAMVKKELDKTIDIHMGGIEHIPIHHTNEIAQSESANGVKYVNYWIHNEHLLVDGKKMSKSEGTSYSLEDIVKKGFNPLDLRYFFLQAHYRSKQNFTWDALTASKSARTRLVKDLSILAKEKADDVEIDKNYTSEFLEIVSDDFNIPAGLAFVWNLIKNNNISASTRYNTIIKIDKVLGLDLEGSVRFSDAEEFEIPKEAQDLKLKRDEARIHKDWKTADEIKSTLLEQYKLSVIDTPSGSKLVSTNAYETN